LIGQKGTTSETAFNQEEGKKSPALFKTGVSGGRGVKKTVTTKRRERKNSLMGGGGEVKSSGKEKKCGGHKKGR